MAVVEVSDSSPPTAPGDAHDELLGLLSNPAAKTRRRPRRASAKRKAKESEPQALRIQGNWKRVPEVATRYELAMAIDRLLKRGRVEIADGRLRLAKWVTSMDPVSSAERWRRADDDLRAYCQRMSVHETRNTAPIEDPTAASTGSMYDATIRRSTPRPGVIKYVIQELRQAGTIGYEELITIVAETGGLEWVLEEKKRAYRK